MNILASLRAIGKKPIAQYKRADGSAWLTVRADASSDSAEMIIEGSIGESWWDGSGTTSKQFRNALNAIPKNKDITVRINSEGGSVGDALSIYNLIKERGNVDTQVDGYALSSASIVAIAGRTVKAPKSSIWMIHEPWAQASGDSQEFQKAAEMLEVHAETMAKLYADKSGKSPEDCRALMKSETWLGGDESAEHGFSDEVLEDDDIETNARAKIAVLDLTRFSNVPVAILTMAKPISPALSSGGAAGTAASISETIETMPNTPTPAAVNPPANTPASASATPAAAPQSAPETISMSDFRALQAQLHAERKARIEARIDRLITVENRLSNDERSDALTRALADESYLDVVAKRPSLFTAGNPITGGHDLEVSGNFLDRIRDMKANSAPHAIGGVRAVTAAARFEERRTNWSQMMAQAKAMDARGVTPHSHIVSSPDAMCVRMAGDTTLPVAASSYATSLIVDQLADGAITQLVNTLAPLRVFARDFMPSAFAPLSTLQVRLVTQGGGTTGTAAPTKTGKGTGTPTATDIDYESNDDHTVTNIPITMYEYSENFYTSSQELMSGGRIEFLANHALQSLGSNIMSDTLANLNGASWSAGVSGGGFFTHYGTWTWNSGSAAADMAYARAQLGKSSVKNALLDPALFSKLITIPVVNAVPLGVPMANSTSMRNVMGWNEIAETTAWATGQGAGGSTYSYGSPIIGFLCNPQAIACGARLPILPPEGVPGNTITMAQVEIPGLDMTVAIFSWFSLRYRTLFHSYGLVYGAHTGDLTAGCVIKSNGA